MRTFFISFEGGAQIEIVGDKIIVSGSDVVVMKKEKIVLQGMKMIFWADYGEAPSYS